MSKKIGRNEPCPCGSGKKYKKCCIDKGINPIQTEKMSLDQVFQFLKDGIENESPDQSHPDRKCRVKGIRIINNDTVVCEFYPYSTKSMEIKVEIGSIMPMIVAFWRDNPHVPQDIRNFAVRAFNSQNEELMYAISSRETAELMCEGKSIEWIQNTIFQDNSDDHRVTLAKRQISEIENALRVIVCEVLANSRGPQWWDQYVDSQTRGDARAAYKNQTGATSTDGSVLISYTYLLKLKKIISDNCSEFVRIFPDNTRFEAWLDDLNAIRREEAHNRPITHAHIATLKQIYNDIMRAISQQYPDIVSSYLSENWRSRISAIIEKYSEKQKSRSVSSELGLGHNMDIVKETISDLSDVDARISSISPPPDKIDSHKELLCLFRDLKTSFEEMISCAEVGDVLGVERARQMNSEVNERIKSFTEKILLGS